MTFRVPAGDDFATKPSDGRRRLPAVVIMEKLRWALSSGAITVDVCPSAVETGGEEVLGTRNAE